MRSAALAATLCAALLAACAPAADDDGELVPTGPLAPAAAKTADARPVVVDTDLGRDDLAAIALLVRHPEIRVEAITVAPTGLVGCEEGRPILAALFRDLDAAVPPVACGTAERAAGGHPFPAAWRVEAAAGSGLRLDAAPVSLAVADATTLLAELATREPGLAVVALGPLTDLAELARRDPAAYRGLAGLLAMAGTTHNDDGGIAEWNAAADPAALAAVLDPALAGQVPVTLVPADAVPPGTPDGLAAPVVGRIAAPGILDRWWDVAAAAAFVTRGEDRADGAERGTWRTDGNGLLVRAGDGPVAVLREVPRAVVEEACAAAF